MRTANLIVAYKNPEQVYRLAKSLQHPNSQTFIHIDRKVDIKKFLYIGDLPGVHFITKRHYIVWGGYSITECYIDGMKEILEFGHFDYFVLMSGQDYPLRPIEEFHKHLRDNKGFSMMTLEAKTPKSNWWFYAHDRYRYYHLNDAKIPFKKLLHKISKRIFPERQFLYPEYQLWGGPGATFCALTKQAAEYVVNFMATSAKARRYAKLTHASDEFWFQTLIMNSPFKDKVINKPLWYIDWKGTSKHPRTLTVLDYPSLIESGLFFGRKFDLHVDEAVMDMLDLHLSERKNLRPALTK